MKFEFEGLSFVIEFERSTRERPSFSKERKPAVVTTARLLRVESDTVTRTVVREGTAAHYWKDQFSYDAGRKCALAKALYDAQTVKGGAPIIGTPLTYEFKQAVWKSYHNRTVASKPKVDLAASGRILGLI